MKTNQKDRWQKEFREKFVYPGTNMFDSNAKDVIEWIESQISSAVEAERRRIERLEAKLDRIIDILENGEWEFEMERRIDYKKQ